MKTRNLLPLAALVLGLLGGCAKQSEDAGAPPEEAAPPPEDSDTPPGKKPGLPPLTNVECEAQGGQVVGDIGDGAIFRPDYTCASGQPPIGVIEADPDGPIAVEGSVCCPI